MKDHTDASPDIHDIHGRIEHVHAVHEDRIFNLAAFDQDVAAHGGIAAAQRLGIEVLVTDHHLPGAELPDCAAMVNPNLPGAASAASTVPS